MPRPFRRLGAWPAGKNCWFLCVGAETGDAVEPAGRRWAMIVVAWEAVGIDIDVAAAVAAVVEPHNALGKDESKKTAAAAAALAGLVATDVAVAPTGVAMGHGSNRQIPLPVVLVPVEAVLAGSNSHWGRRWLWSSVFFEVAGVVAGAQPAQQLGTAPQESQFSSVQGSCSCCLSSQPERSWASTSRRSAEVFHGEPRPCAFPRCLALPESRS